MIMATSAEVDSSEGPPKKRQNETFEEKAFRKVSELRETGHDTEDYCCQPNMIRLINHDGIIFC